MKVSETGANSIQAEESATPCSGSFIRSADGGIVDCAEYPQVVNFITFQDTCVSEGPMAYLSVPLTGLGGFPKEYCRLVRIDQISPLA